MNLFENMYFWCNKFKKLKKNIQRIPIKENKFTDIKISSHGIVINADIRNDFYLQWLKFTKVGIMISSLNC